MSSPVIRQNLKGVIQRIALCGILILPIPSGARSYALGGDDQLLIPESRHVWYKMICAGNLTGLGIGLHCTPSSWLGIDGLLGFQLPYSPIWASPYPSNQAALNLRLRLTHHSGVYAAAGWFGGAYEINRTGSQVDASHLFYVNAPTMAVGMAWPTQPTEVQILLEVGAAWGLPERLVKNSYDALVFYRLTARRSSFSTGKLLPFFTILFQL
jgi:hypothetical protein